MDAERNGLQTIAMLSDTDNHPSGAPSRRSTTLLTLLKFGQRRQESLRPKIKITLKDTVVYAVGDVHGCHDALLSLEQKIVADSARFDGRKLIIMLGDYIDRGPQSSRVVEHLTRPPPEGFERICLAGNHETALVDYLDGKLSREAWLAGGGGPTLLSYGIDPAYLTGLYGEEIDDVVRSSIPPEHVNFLRSLPVMAHSGRLVFVHA